MIVLRTLATGVVSHAGVRATEWIGLLPLMGIGYSMYSEPDAIQQVASFQILLGWFTIGTWAKIFAIAWVARFIALVVNGSFNSFKYSPAIRFAVSCFAGMIWFAVTMGVFEAWRSTGGSPTAMYVYFGWAVLELRNAYVSRVDMAIVKG